MSDRFATYPKMTESGDDLFCRIPASWDRLRIKQLFQVRKDIAGRLGYPVWSVTQHGLREKDITSGEGQLSMDYSKYQLLRVGDLVMNHMDLITGGVDIGWKEGVTSPDYRVFIPRRNAEVNKQFFVWLFRLCYWTKKFYSLGQGSAHLGRWRLPTRAFESIVVPVPTLPEQKQIAAFLDYETAKIDALIEKQQQLIALLGEKRQAVISHAVTKGLNPDAPMRDSGIEWLGEVPEHWDVLSLKMDALVSGGYAFKSDDFGSVGVPVIRIGDVGTDGVVAVDSCKRISQQIASSCERYFVHEGDILMAMTGATIGKAGRIPTGKVAVLNQRVGAFKLVSDRLSYEFLWFLIQSGGYQEHVWLEADGGAQPNISDTEMLSYHYARPPKNEQILIVDALKQKLPVFDSLVERCEVAMELLQERRTALISAAVTGKIDVRGWKPPSSARIQETEMEVP